MTADALTAIGAPPARPSSARGAIADRFFFVPLIWIYVAMVQFGLLVRFSAEETSTGYTTVIVFAMIIFGVIRWFRAFLEEPIFWVFAAFLFYLMLPSMLAPRGTLAIRQWLSLSAYVMLAATVSRANLSGRRLKIFWFLIAAGLAVSAALTIIDYLGIVNVPRNNDLRVVTKLGFASVEQASGFFARRSAMAFIFAIGITGSLILALSIRSLLLRVFYLSAGALGLVCLFLTHNRSGVLASVVAVSAYVLFSHRFRGFKRIAVVPAAILLGTLAILGLQTFFPEVTEVYLTKLGIIGLSEDVWESDLDRFVTFERAATSMLSRPLGNGLTLIPMLGRTIDAHNILTTIIWAVGAFSLIWIPAFAFTMYMYLSQRSARRRGHPVLSAEEEAVQWVLLTWIVEGMAHSSIFGGIAWIMLGVMVSNRNQRERLERAAAEAPQRSLPEPGGEFGGAAPLPDHLPART